jgi:hypothetical protein
VVKKWQINKIKIKELENSIIKQQQQYDEQL